ncbi:hypothetical protein WR25_01038 [Diploscapter pachys]|uniref:Uncharacterized protein n=1 Tax=Diploscapter pachys TaxID=2018661 RepID=A0A2A2JSR8_9BILA|nr:hypothetical protein WR25_01038 [Diploscapter pachys]
MVSGLSPVKLIAWLKTTAKIHTGRAALIISLISCFAGGVFLSVCMLDMLPDSLEAWEGAKNDTGFDSDYPFVQLFALSGFFFVYLIEILSDHVCGGHNDEDMHHGPRSRFATEGNIFSSEGNLVLDKKFEFELNPEEQPFTKSLTLILAFLLHVGLECFAFGIQDVNINQTGRDVSTSVLMSLSLGTFFYITFFEILAPEFFNHRNQFLKYLATLTSSDHQLPRFKQNPFPPLQNSTPTSNAMTTSINGTTTDTLLPSSSTDEVTEHYEKGTRTVYTDDVATLVLVWVSFLAIILIVFQMTSYDAKMSIVSGPTAKPEGQKVAILEDAESEEGEQMNLHIRTK